jgi:glutathione reductase (NADPH)
MAQVSSTRYDLVVVGSGTATMVGAMKARKAGWTVAIADYRPFGGTCALRNASRRRCCSQARWPLIIRAGCKAMASRGHSDHWPELMTFKQRHHCQGASPDDVCLPDGRLGYWLHALTL